MQDSSMLIPKKVPFGSRILIDPNIHLKINVDPGHKCVVTGTPAAKELSEDPYNPNGEKGELNMAK